MLIWLQNYQNLPLNTFRISKNVYINQLDEIVNQYNNTYHGTNKIKLDNVNPSMYIDFNREYNNEGSKLKIGDNVRVSNDKNVFAKGYIANWSEKFFVVKQV